MEETIVPIYNPGKIEKKWQRIWADEKIYEANIDNSRPKHYALTMLPYPSGNLHIARDQDGRGLCRGDERKIFGIGEKGQITCLRLFNAA